MLKRLAGIMIALCLCSCSKAIGNGVHAEIIPSPDGSTCYGIFNDSDNVVGGNCR